LNYRIVARTLGTMFLIIACCMIPSAIVAIYCKDDLSLSSFLLVSFIMTVIGIILKTIPKSNAAIRVREGYLIVVLTWFMVCFFCALPYYISGAIPNFFDALFESTSGVTTTGSSILSDIEGLPKAMIFWRGFTHWMGGLGILTMAIAILPALGISGFQMAKAEASNSNLDKTSPKMTDMAKMLYKTYFTLTALCIILLLLGGMGWLDASAHAFSAIATGGFSSRNLSVGYFDSVYVDTVLSIFMVIGSISFPLLYAAFVRKKHRSLFKNEEIRLFAILLFAGSTFTALNLLSRGIYDSIGESIRYGFFQTISIMTTTGFSTTDYNLWPSAIIILLLMLVFCGGCSGSTAGGVKVIRILIFFKLLWREFKRKLHPKAVYAIKVKNEIANSDVSITAATYIIFFFILCMAGGIIVSFDPGSDLITAFTASFASATNLGPGFGLVGPYGNYGFFQDWTKTLLSFLMIVGKLEIFAVLMLFTPQFWNPDK